MTERWRYWLDYFWLPPVITSLIAIQCRSIEWALWFAGGFVAWTFVEYWVHRTALHVFFWHGTHERHHNSPAEYVETIWWYTPPLFVVLFLVFPGSLFAGFCAGYLWFLTMHHWLHHINLREHTWLHRYAIWHNRHHKLSNCNYGITVPVWDWAFGTSR